MGMHEGRARVAKSVKELLARWSETRSHWDDAASRAFEDRHIHPVEVDSRQALNAMDGMAQVLMQAKRDCE